MVLPDPPRPDFDFDVYVPRDRAAPVYAIESYGILPGEEAAETADENWWDDAMNYPPRQGVASPRYTILGAVKIPRLSLSENLFIGTEDQMKYGLGYLEGSAIPGEKGNTVISGHRVSSIGKHPFRHLDKLQEGDVVTVEVGEEIFSYEVFDMFIVSKEEVWVLQPVREEAHLLTLITCDPVISAGARPDRLIVRARTVTG
jgi:sortase A